MDRLEADEVLRFQCYSSIYLKTRDAVCYSGTSKFNRELAYRPDSWHQVKVMHNGDYSKEEILSAFFEIMRDTTFAPVSYYVGESLDSFVFPSSNKMVVKNMFRKSLKLTMPSGKPLHFSVTLGVAKTSSDQISLKKVLWKILDTELNKLRHYQGVKDVLFLEKLAIHPECRDICVSLGNPGTLQTLLEILITCFSKSVKNVKGINLRKNEITNLSSFKVLVEFVNELELLDLRCNEIPQESVAALRPLKIQNLLISKNRFSLSYDVLCLFGKELPYVIKVDGEDLPKDSSVKIEPEKKVFVMWHQVSVKHGRRFDKNQILKTIFMAVDNTLEPLYPCYYQTGFEEDTFLVKKCEKQLMHLETMGVIEPIGALTIKWDCRREEENEMNIKQETLVAIKRGYDSISKTLNLSEFSASDSLKNIELFLGNSNALNEIIGYVTKLYTTPLEIKHLNVSQNEIFDITSLSKLSYYKNLTALDLSFNNIERIQNLEPLAVLSKSLSVINLHGNPVCSTFFTAQQYVHSLLTIFPNLTTIDSQEINPKDYKAEEFFSSKRNYLCSLEGYDLVDFFVETFFTTWNVEGKHFEEIIKNFYSSDAVLSYSFSYENKSLLSSKNELNIRKHRRLSRNLKLNAEDSYRANKPFQGHSQINSFFKEVADFIFDIPTFAVDLAVFNPEMAVVIVNGLMTEKSLTRDCDVLYNFSRTFVLKPVEKNIGFKGKSVLYKIYNELWHTSSPTVKQCKTYERTWTPPEQDTNWKPNSINEQTYFINMLQQITDLKPDKCEFALSSNNWDFSNTLNKFYTLLSKNEIPEEDFILPLDKMQSFDSEEDTDISNLFQGETINEPNSSNVILPIAPPMPINYKVENTVPDPPIEELRTNIPDAFPSTSIQVVQTLPKPLMKRSIKSELNLEQTQILPRPNIQVKVEQIPDIKPRINVKKENVLTSEVLKVKSLQNLIETSKATPASNWEKVDNLPLPLNLKMSPKRERDEALILPKPKNLKVEKVITPENISQFAIRSDLLRSEDNEQVLRSEGNGQLLRLDDNEQPSSSSAPENKAISSNLLTSFLNNINYSKNVCPINSQEKLINVSKNLFPENVARRNAEESEGDISTDDEIDINRTQLNRNETVVCSSSGTVQSGDRYVPMSNFDDFSMEDVANLPKPGIIKLEPENINYIPISNFDDFSMEDVANLPQPGIIKLEPPISSFDDFSMENVSNLPQPGIIKLEATADASSEEPEFKKIKLETPIKTEETKEWPVPFMDVKKE